jgi:hypothetical protein
MNFAILNKVRFVSGVPEELIQQLRQATRQLQLKNISEIVFYRSPVSPNELFVISFWYQLQSNQPEKPVARDFFQRLETKGELVERETFRLTWEYRLLTQRTTASHIRLMTFPEDFPQAKIDQIINYPRKRRLEVPAVVGHWMGRSFNNPHRTLHRVDWSRLEDRINYFNMPSTRQMIEERKASGIDIEYASFDLQELIESPPNQLYNNDLLLKARV